MFGNSASGIWAANAFIWGNVVKPFDTYCLGYLTGVNCSNFQQLNQVTEYFDQTSGQWRSNFAALGSFESVNGISGAPIYAVAVVIPEPASLLLLGTGLLGIAAVARRRRRTNK